MYTYFISDSLKDLEFVVQYSEATLGWFLTIEYKSYVPSFPTHVVKINKRCIQTKWEIIKYYIIKNNSSTLLKFNIFNKMNIVCLIYQKWNENRTKTVTFCAQGQYVRFYIYFRKTNTSYLFLYALHYMNA